MRHLFSARLLPVVAAAAMAGVLGVDVKSAHAQQFVNNFGDGIDPTTGAGDDLWSNAANWNAPIPGPGQVAWINVSAAHDTTPPKQGGPATINYAAPSPSEIYIGQGAGDGHVLMTTGGSIATTNINMAHDQGRSGIFDQDGGSTTVTGTVNAGQQATGGAATINISGGTFTSGNMHIGDLNAGGSQMTVTGGTVTTTGTTGIRLSDVSAGSTASSSLSITGGTVDTQLIAVGARSGGTGSGALTIGGDANVNLRQNMFIRPNNGSITIDGSAATITGNRAGATGYEAHTGTDTNFIFDSAGISTINLNGSSGSRLQFSNVAGEPTGILNVDVSEFAGEGDFYLFRFVDTIAGGVLGTGEFSQHNVTGLDGRTASFDYIRDQGVAGNGLVMTLVPEPSALGLLAVAGLFGLRRRRA